MSYEGYAWEFRSTNLLIQAKLAFYILLWHMFAVFCLPFFIPLFGHRWKLEMSNFTKEKNGLHVQL